MSGISNGIKKSVAAIAMVAILAMAPLAMAQDGGRSRKSVGKPVYPELAKKMNISGTVKVEVVVTPAGSVRSAKALGGHPLLIEAAVTAAKQSKFEAGPDETTEVIPFQFTLGGN